MNKDKLIKAIIWASMFSFCVLLCAFFIYVEITEAEMVVTFLLS